LINKAGLKVSEAHTGAVTLIQHFGSALNLNLALGDVERVLRGNNCIESVARLGLTKKSVGDF